MYIYISTHIYMYTCTYTYTHIHTSIHIYDAKHIQQLSQSHTVFIHAKMEKCMHVCTKKDRSIFCQNNVAVPAVGESSSTPARFFKIRVRHTAHANDADVPSVGEYFPAWQSKHV